MTIWRSFLQGDEGAFRIACPDGQRHAASAQTSQNSQLRMRYQSQRCEVRVTPVTFSGGNGRGPEISPAVWKLPGEQAGRRRPNWWPGAKRGIHRITTPSAPEGRRPARTDSCPSTTDTRIFSLEDIDSVTVLSTSCGASVARSSALFTMLHDRSTQILRKAMIRRAQLCIAPATI